MTLITRQRKLKQTSNNSNFQQPTGTSTGLPTPSPQPATTLTTWSAVGHSWRSDPQDISGWVLAVEDEQLDQKCCSLEGEDA